LAGRRPAAAEWAEEWVAEWAAEIAAVDLHSLHRSNSKLLKPAQKKKTKQESATDEQKRTVFLPVLLWRVKE
jgi:hypothetical protein